MTYNIKTHSNTVPPCTQYRRHCYHHMANSKTPVQII